MRPEIKPLTLQPLLACYEIPGVKEIGIRKERRREYWHVCQTTHRSIATSTSPGVVTSKVILNSSLDSSLVFSLCNRDNYKPPRLPLWKQVAESDVFRFDWSVPNYPGKWYICQKSSIPAYRPSDRRAPGASVIGEPIIAHRGDFD